MENKREFDNILDECLDKVMQGQDIETILALYPQYAVELEPLLRTARDTMQAAEIKPRPEFRQQAGYEFQAALRKLPPQKTPHVFRWQLRWVAPVAIIIVLLLGGGGTVLAANNALPDNPLYTVKLATEAVQMAFTRSDLGKAELYAKFANERVAEIVKMSEKGNNAQVQNTTQRMNDELVAMVNLTSPEVQAAGGEQSLTGLQAPAATSTGFPPETVTNTTVSPTTTTTTTTSPTIAAPTTTTAATTMVPTTVPAPTATAPSPDLSTASQPPVATEVMPPPVIITAGPASSPTPTAPEGLRHTYGQDNSKNASQNNKNANKNFVKNQKVKDDFARKFGENLRALQNQLDKAPENLKPALKRAIDILKKGYEESISNLEAAGSSYIP